MADRSFCSTAAAAATVTTTVIEAWKQMQEIDAEPNVKAVADVDEEGREGCLLQRLDRLSRLLWSLDVDKQLGSSGVLHVRQPRVVGYGDAVHAAALTIRAEGKAFAVCFRDDLPDRLVPQVSQADVLRVSQAMHRLRHEARVEALIEQSLCWCNTLIHADVGVRDAVGVIRRRQEDPLDPMIAYGDSLK